jgi:hypothetical protein
MTWIGWSIIIAGIMIACAIESLKKIMDNLILVNLSFFSII